MSRTFSRIFITFSLSSYSFPLDFLTFSNDFNCAHSEFKTVVKNSVFILISPYTMSNFVLATKLSDHNWLWTQRIKIVSSVCKSAVLFWMFFLSVFSSSFPPGSLKWSTFILITPSGFMLRKLPLILLNFDNWLSFLPLMRQFLLLCVVLPEFSKRDPCKLFCDCDFL